MRIETIVILLPIICNGYPEMDVISRLTDYFNFDHHLLLLNSTADANSFINRFTPQTLYVLRDDDDVTGLENVKEINSKNTFMIIASDTSKFKHNLLLGIKNIQRLQSNMKIGVFFSQCLSTQDLYNFFEWCKDHQIVNIFAATYLSLDNIQGSCSERPLNIFTFNPFGTFYVINVTSSATYYVLNSHFYQHKFRLNSFQNDSNRMFWLTIFRFMNASFVEVENEKNFTEASEAIENGFDIVNFLWGVEELKHLNIYPLLMLPMVILVPEASPYSEFSSYLRNAVSNEIIGYSTISIVVAILILSIVRYIKRKNIFFFQSAADVLNLILNDNGYIKYQRLSCMESFIIVPLTFIGFVVTNSILSNLKSYLTRPLLQPQINTPEDIYKSSLSILTTNEAWKNEIIDVLSNRTKRKNWGNKIIVTTGTDFLKCIESYNRTLAYSLDLRYAKILLRIQKRLNINGYHNPHIITSITYFSYRVSEKFIFFERLTEIINRIKSSGLYDLWIQSDDARYEARILRENIERVIDHEEAYIESFVFPMFVLYGWLTGLIVFICEIVWKTLKIICLNKINRSNA